MADTSVATRTVPAVKLRGVTTAVFAALGLPHGDAALMGELLVDADLRGVHSHGTRWVVRYARWLQGGANTNPKITAVHDDGPTAALDGDGGLGHIVSVYAMKLAIDKARRHGTGVVTVRNSNHCGAMAYYTGMAADAGCIGFATSTAGILMAPTGGRDKLIGVNPASWGFPTSRGWNLDLDMAPSIVAGSKIDMAKIRGEKIPLGLALDKDGNPTDDPAKAQEGVLLPAGGIKGYALAVVFDVLSGVLSGGRFGKGLGMEGGSQIFQAIDVERFMPLDEFKGRMEQLIAQIKGSALAPGSNGVFLPGEIEYMNKQERLENGIAMEATTLRDIETIASELDIADRPSRWG